MNSRCPDCRTEFEQDFTDRKLLNQDNNEQQLDVIHENNEEDEN